jgi:hypothetical protein
MSYVETETQQERARQYILCTYALRHGRRDGAEAIFDQALTNGLAAIVADTWPGAELNGTRILPARELLKLIQKHGKVDDAHGHARILHDPDGPEFIDHPAWGPEPNFTTVRAAELHDGLIITQAIRHARADGLNSTEVLTTEHIGALAELGTHPVFRDASSAINEKHDEGQREGIRNRDHAECQRAAAYYDGLDAEERTRREDIDYSEEHHWETKHGRSAVEYCPVCSSRALVVRMFDRFTDEIGIGTCHVCSYRRAADVAEEDGFELDLGRAIERMMARDD